MARSFIAQFGISTPDEIARYLTIVAPPSLYALDRLAIPDVSAAHTLPFPFFSERSAPL
jgi:hypothetical protein